jgi:hypothetical protein
MERRDIGIVFLFANATVLLTKIVAATLLYFGDEKVWHALFCYFYATLFVHKECFFMIFFKSVAMPHFFRPHFGTIRTGLTFKMRDIRIWKIEKYFQEVEV